VTSCCRERLGETGPKTFFQERTFSYLHQSLFTERKVVEFPLQYIYSTSLLPSIPEEEEEEGGGGGFSTPTFTISSPLWACRYLFIYQVTSF
jgi:hypothetical protein